MRRTKLGRLIESTLNGTPIQAEFASDLVLTSVILGNRQIGLLDPTKGEMQTIFRYPEIFCQASVDNNGAIWFSVDENWVGKAEENDE